MLNFTLGPKPVRKQESRTGQRKQLKSDTVATEALADLGGRCLKWVEGTVLNLT